MWIEPRWPQGSRVENHSIGVKGRGPFEKIGPAERKDRPGRLCDDPDVALRLAEACAIEEPEQERQAVADDSAIGRRHGPDGGQGRVGRAG